jgi:hypothetical protein
MCNALRICFRLLGSWWPQPVTSTAVASPACGDEFAAGAGAAAADWRDVIDGRRVRVWVFEVGVEPAAAPVADVGGRQNVRPAAPVCPVASA